MRKIWTFQQAAKASKYRKSKRRSMTSRQSPGVKQPVTHSSSPSPGPSRSASQPAPPFIARGACKFNWGSGWHEFPTERNVYVQDPNAETGAHGNLILACHVLPAACNKFLEMLLVPSFSCEDRNRDPYLHVPANKTKSKFIRSKLFIQLLCQRGSTTTCRCATRTATTNASTFYQLSCARH